MIYHADMYACPNLDVEILKHLEPGKVVSATRIEPPLHPDGPEKILEDFGIEPEEFRERELLRFVDGLDTGDLGQETSQGIFAPWAIYKEDFLSIGGHDPLYAPQSKEDSDIFNRFVLAGYDLVQTWKGFVYHMTCRGSRFKDGAKRNPDGEVFMKGRESDEWLEQNIRSTRNYIRKWGCYVKHDEMLKPIVMPKYNIGFVVENCGLDEIKVLEPWCGDIYGDWVGHKGYHINKYIEEEQPNTTFDLSKKIHTQHTNPTNDVIVRFDCSKITQNDFDVLQNISAILKDSGQIGILTHGNLEFEIRNLKTYEKDLILVK